MRRSVGMLADGARPYRDRVEAGAVLAQKLAAHAGRGAVVLALPRGGVPVAFQVARALRAELDLMVVRKLGCPGHEELAAGAIATGGARVTNPEIAELIDERDLDAVEARERVELARRERVYRDDRPMPKLAGRTTILVDDGLATGASMRAAILAARVQGPARIVVAVPVAPAETVTALRDLADEVVCPETPSPFFAIGQWYEDFAQVNDQVVRDLLRRAWGEPGDGAGDEVTVVAGGAELRGLLAVPEGARGLAIFAHGSGSSRLSTRNRAVARALNAGGLGTLLFDLLTAAEQEVDAVTPELRFDLELLTHRVVGAIDWARARPGLPAAIGLFGSSRGAAAALRAAAERPEVVRAIVSRGGRPELALQALSAVRAPTLLIVGGKDLQVLALNRQAEERLAAPSEVAIVRGATHLFEEPGALQEVARLAGDWFRRFLIPAPRR